MHGNDSQKRHVSPWRVFVSSTSDLERDRRAVERVINQMRDADYAGMEYFPSSAKEPLKTCLDEVAQCSVYLGLFGHRYGHVAPSEQVSMTELEYRKACELGKPLLIYIKKGLNRESKTEQEQQTLIEELLQKHTCKFYKNSAQLERGVALDLHNSIIEFGPSPSRLEPPSRAWPLKFSAGLAVIALAGFLLWDFFFNFDLRPLPHNFTVRGSEFFLDLREGDKGIDLAGYGLEMTFRTKNNDLEAQLFFKDCQDKNVWSSPQKVTDEPIRYHPDPNARNCNVCEFEKFNCINSVGANIIGNIENVTVVSARLVKPGLVFPFFQSSLYGTSGPEG